MFIPVEYDAKSCVKINFLQQIRPTAINCSKLHLFRILSNFNCSKCSYFFFSENLLFQTFSTRKCYRRWVYGLRCVPQYVEYLAPVYKGDTYEVIPRYIKVPTGCAMSFV